MDYELQLQIFDLKKYEIMRKKRNLGRNVIGIGRYEKEKNNEEF